ncbi:MAG TPA: GDSL-type esterase/lipase family protein [Polyangiaceae bacterium]
MPQSRRLLVVALLFACGQATALGDRAEVAEKAKAPTFVRPVPQPSSSVASAAAPIAQGPLDNTAALKRFFEALSKLDDASAQNDVRIVQFGDSHTAADLMTGAARHVLQARFGDGGRGFVEIGRPYRYYWQDGLKSPGMTRDFHAERGKLEHGKFVGDGCYGLGGVCLVTSAQGARAWAELASPASKIEVDYWEQPGGGSFDLVIDGSPVLTVKTRGAEAGSAFQSVVVPDGPHKVEVRARGDGEVRVFGVTLDRDRNGVVYDALGLNGARASTTLQWSEPHMAEQLRHTAPDLVVLAYGTNESADEESIDAVSREIVAALGRVERAVPAAACLLLGPPDRAVRTASDNPYTPDAGTFWATSPRIEQIVAAERKIADAAGCAFYDQLAAMGGPGTIAAWAEMEPPRAQRDRTHLTREGYAMLGNAFANDLLAAYVAFRAERGLAPKAPPAPSSPPLLPQPAPNESAAPGSAPFVAIPL